MQVLKGQRRSAKVQQAAAQRKGPTLQEQMQKQMQQRQQQKQKQPQGGMLTQRGWPQRQCQQ